MELESGSDAADLAEQGLAFFTPFGEIGRRVRFFGAAGENEVADLQIVRTANVGRSPRIDRFGHEERGFAHFVAGAVIAADGRVEFAFVNDDGVVAEPRGVRVAIFMAAEEQRDDDEGVFFRDEEAAGLHIGDLQFQFANQGLQFAVSRGGEAFDGVFGLRFLQTGLPFRDERIGCGGLLGPAVAGAGLVVIAEVNVLIERGHAVAVAAIGHDIHLRLNEERAALRGRVCELEDGLAVVVVVLVEDLVEAREVVLHAGGLALVKLVEEAADLRRRQHRFEAWEQLRQVRIDAREIWQRLIGLGNADGELKARDVSLRIEFLQAGKGAFLGDEIGFDLDAVVERGDVHLFAWNELIRQRRRHFFDDLHLFDDLLRHFLHDIACDLTGDDALFFLRGSRGLDELLNATFDLPCDGREGQQQEHEQHAEENQLCEAAGAAAFRLGRHLRRGNRRRRVLREHDWSSSAAMAGVSTLKVPGSQFAVPG